MQKKCIQCNKYFVSKKNTIELRLKAKFCSHRCYWTNMITSTRGEKNPSWKGEIYNRKCLICKKVFRIDRTRLDAKTCSMTCNRTYRQTEGFRMKLSQKVRLSVPKPIRDTRILRRNLRKSSIYNLWRSKVLKRDNYTCQLCGKRGGKLHSDHIKSFIEICLENKIKTYKQALECKQLWDLNNGRTLCVPCHYKTPNFGSKILFTLTK